MQKKDVIIEHGVLKGEVVLEEEKAQNNYWKIINKFIVSSEKAHMLPIFLHVCSNCTR